MNLIANLDIFSVGIVVAATAILAYIVFISNRHSISNRLFSIFSVITISWTVINYLSYQTADANLALLLLRLEIFLAVWLCFLLFILLLVFPKENAELPGFIKLLVIPVSLVSILNLTPLVFIRVASFSVDGHAAQVTNGPGIIIFGITVLILIVSAILNLLKKTIHTEGLERKQLRAVLTGISITFSLLIIFNFILPAFFNDARYIPFGGVFIFPLIVAITYAIFKHRLLNIKVLSTEILTFVLTIALLFEVIISDTIVLLAFRFSLFLLVLGVGILLIQSVRKEVKQREQLQALTGQLKKANEKLTALDQARAEFISIVSHQLRTPPATIKWYLSAILSGDYGQLDPEVKTALEKTQRTNNSLISLIEDILNVSRIERGKLEFLFEPTDLVDLVHITVEQLYPIAKDKGLTLMFSPPEKPLPKIMADKEKLRQVMNNLIDNAIKYTKEGSILVELFEEKGNGRFQVTDTGKGIAPQEQKEIFQKYKRGKESIKQSAGLGLGLYVAKVIITQHKGKIWAESKGEGKGSMFAFTIPIKNNLRATSLVDFTDSKEPQTVGTK